MLIDPQVLKNTSASVESSRQASLFGLFGRKKNNRALLNKIMIWMFGPLFLLWTLGLVITYFISQNIAIATYDRTLSDHLSLLKHDVDPKRILIDIPLRHSSLLIFQCEP